MSTAPALPATMRAVVMRAPGDVVVENVEVPRVVHPTDVVLKIEAACVCGSDLWPYRGLQPVENRRMGHEYVGTVVEVGADVKSMSPQLRSSSPLLPSSSPCRSAPPT